MAFARYAITHPLGAGLRLSTRVLSKIHRNLIRLCLWSISMYLHRTQAPFSHSNAPPVSTPHPLYPYFYRGGGGGYLTGVVGKGCLCIACKDYPVTCEA